MEPYHSDSIVCFLLSISGDSAHSLYRFGKAIFDGRRLKTTSSPYHPVVKMNSNHANGHLRFSSRHNHFGSVEWLDADGVTQLRRVSSWLGHCIRPRLVHVCHSSSSRSSVNVALSARSLLICTRGLNQKHIVSTDCIQASTFDPMDPQSPAETAEHATDGHDKKPTDDSQLRLQNVDPPVVDLELTHAKLYELGQDVQQLEAAIRTNENARKDLDDWFFDQMTATAVEPEPFVSTSTSEAGIKRIFEDQSRVLMQRSKALSDQLNATRYVIDQLEMRGIPMGASPKTYVRRLLKHRGKGHSATTPPRSLRPSGQFRVLYLQIAHYRVCRSDVNVLVCFHNLILMTSGSKDGDSCDPSPVVVRKPERFISNTMPTISSSVVSTLPTAEAQRQARTLPVAIQATDIQLHRRNSGPNLTSSNMKGTHFGLDSDEAAFNSDFLNAYPTTTMGYNKFQTPVTQPLPLTSFNQPASSSVKPHIFPHPTSPDLFSINYTEDPVEFGSKTSRVLPASGKLPHVGTTNVLRSVRHGLGIFGRQFRPPQKGRSASEENFVVCTKLGDRSSDNQPTGERPAKLGSWIWGRSGWPSSHLKRKNKRRSQDTTDPGGLLNVPEIVSNDPSCSYKSNTGSACSHNGAAFGTTSLLNLPSTGPRGRSLSAYGGSTPMKEELLRNVSGPSNESTGPADYPLSNILELLTVNMCAYACPTGKGSSSSSVSMPCPTGPCGSNGLRGLAPLGTHKENNPAVAPSLSVTGDSPLNISHPLSSTVVPTTNSFAPIATGNVALALTAMYKLWNNQLSNMHTQQTEYFQTIRNELAVIRKENLQLQEISAKLTAEIGSISRDAQTREELQKQKLSDATARIEQLDATAEESRQSMQREMVLLRTEFRDTLANIEYQLTTKTRDLSDSIATVSNKVSIIEKPLEQHTVAGTHGSDRAQIRRKVLHYLTDLCVSLFALLTMLLQVLIRFLNLGAVVTENRALGMCLAVFFVVGFFLVYTSEPLISILHGTPVTDFSAIPSTGTTWRDTLITILSIFRRFARGSS
ncbi:hypothetical protein P879_05901 [Paragonimus westermani]|uniref:Uncharacterized protein n=1 Tax=Paragonimus westermani TaxID=34504 RepID=A0A8T0D388_9TREM|nr:hypothetical protein P879_05901 [Paragonimus westermani]